MQHATSRLVGAILILALLAVGGLVVLARAGAHSMDGVGGSAAPASPTSCPNPPLHGGFGVSYVSWPENLHQLKAMSDLVAEVRIVSFVRTESYVPGVYSVFTARVMTPIASKHAAGIAAGATIQIRQMGGRVGCITYTLDGDPMMRPGERDILFLTAATNDSVYNIIDNTVGRFTVGSNEQIAPNANTPVNVSTGTSDTTFIKQIQQA